MFVCIDSQGHLANTPWRVAISNAQNGNQSPVFFFFLFRSHSMPMPCHHFDVDERALNQSRNNCLDTFSADSKCCHIATLKPCAAAVCAPNVLYIWRAIRDGRAEQKWIHLFFVVVAVVDIPFYSQIFFSFFFCCCESGYFICCLANAIHKHRIQYGKSLCHMEIHLSLNKSIIRISSLLCCCVV